MQWYGGKHAIKRHIVDLFLPHNDGRPYLEPFVGGCNVLMEVNKHWIGPMVAGDINHDYIKLFQASQQGLIPPFIQPTREMVTTAYTAYKAGDRSIETLCVGALNTCGGRAMFRNGFTRDYSATRNTPKERYNSMVTIGQFRGDYVCADYCDHVPVDSLVYCDPPYNSAIRGHGHKKYVEYTNKFDTKKFWDLMRRWSNNNIVYVSEREAPDDFRCVLERPKTLVLNFPHCKKVIRYMEKVWRLH